MATSRQTTKTVTYPNDNFYGLGSGTFYGDGIDSNSTITSNEVGGNDVFLDNNYDTNVIYGDTYSITGTGIGGADQFFGGRYGQTTMFGDAETMYNSALGGNDTLQGGAEAENYLYGDANAMRDNAKGGRDVLTGGEFAVNVLIGESDTMADNAQGGSDTIRGGDNTVNNYLLGDGSDMRGSAVGAADLLTGGNATVNSVETYNYFLADGVDAFDAAAGGNDTLRGGNATFGVDHNYMFGDFDNVAAGSTVKCGADDLKGGSGCPTGYVINIMVGDFADIDGAAVKSLICGADVITGGELGENRMFGDSLTSLIGTTGGNDVIYAGNYSMNILVGDASAGDHAIGGNDRLVSAVSDDDMFGDFVNVDGYSKGGNDIFVFASANAHDEIFDFVAGQDKINLSAFKKLDSAFSSTGNLVKSGRIEYGDFNSDGHADAKIHTSVGGQADGDNFIIVYNNTGSDSWSLHSSDFII